MKNILKTLSTITLAIMSIASVGILSTVESSYAWHDFLQPTWTSGTHTFDCLSNLTDINEDSYVDPCNDFETATNVWDTVSNSNWDLDENSSGAIPIGSSDLGNGSPTTMAQTTVNLNFWNDITSASMDFNNNNVVSFTDTDQTTLYAYDYISVSVHEIGHLLHLKHNSETTSPMYYSLSPDVKNITLTAHDRSVIAGMY